MIDLTTGEIREAAFNDLETWNAPFMRTKWNYDRNEASKKSGLLCTEPTMAQQQFAEECDINTIVERFGLTGELPNNLRVPITDEFLDIVDYHTAANQLLEADNAFMQMPAKIRERFGNNAGRFVDFVSDPKNLEECKEMGLAAPERPLQAPIEVRVIPTPSDDGKIA